MILSVCLYLITIVVNMACLGLIAKTGRSVFFYSVFNVLWAMICGLVIIGNSMLVRSGISKPVISGIAAAEAILALAVHATLTWALAPELAVRFAIDGVELLLLPISTLFLCLFSYLLGRTLTQNHMVWKLSA